MVNVELGFDTIGNATIVAYDRRPIIVTDPWVRGTAYFGSWGMSHEIPEEQMDAVRNCQYVWFSHGHPDHLNPDCLELFRGKKILLPDHVGGRIQRQLAADGFDVSVLEDRKWTPLSDRIRVLCIADLFQDGIMLLDVGGRLLIDLNDAIDHGWGRSVRKMAKRYEISFLLSLTGYGDADMINFYDEDGTFIEPPCAKKIQIGPTVAQKAESWGARYFVPFSSMHRYRRIDSAYANEYITPPKGHAEGFESDRCAILPAFIRYDCLTDQAEPLNPREQEAKLAHPSEFGDDWSETLERSEVETLTRYFRRFGYLATFLDFVAFRVGGREHRIEYRTRNFDRGTTFEVPRHSLMESVRYEIFDDLLIGNFMRTTLHGNWPESKLYPDFTPYVTKFGDNGHAHTPEELRAYLRAYRRRAPLAFIHSRLEHAAIDTVRRYTSHDSQTFRNFKAAYWRIKKFV